MQIITIKLPSGQLVKIDNKDYILCSQYKWWFDRGYARTRVNGKKLYLHRLIMGNPKGKQIDHKNHDGLDCRKVNMRICTKNQNNIHRKPKEDCSSCYKGVCWHNQTGKWVARITFNRKMKYLGVFELEIDAAKAYDKSAVELFGEYAYLNFERKVS